MPTTTTTATPILLSPPIVTADGSIDLVFSTAMAAGTGTIIITDGAIQTVIDRATGLPTMRAVGANDTHVVSASSVSIEGTHVKLNVPGLQPNTQYSIVMASGVLASSDHVAFGGLRSTSQATFTVPSGGDQDGPAFVSATLDASLLKAGGSLKATLTFSEIVNGLTADALNAPNATVSAVSKVGDGHVWEVTLVPSGPVEQAGNTLTIDMGKVHDAAGNAGAGTGSAGSYAVDTRGPSATIELDGNELLNGGSIGVTIALTDKIADAGVLASLLGTPNAAIAADSLASSDGGFTWKAVLQLSASAVAPANALTLDLSGFHDAAGNAGSIVKSGNYQVDPTVTSFVQHEIDITDWYGPSEDDHVSSNAYQNFHGTLSADLQEHQHLMLTIDGGDEFEAAVDGTGWWDGQDGMHFTDGVHRVTARVVDDAHHASASFTQQFTIDTAAPVMLSSPDGGAGSTATDFVFTFNEAMYLIEGEGYSRLRIEDTGGNTHSIQLLPEWLSADRKTLTVPASSLGLQEGRDYSFTLSSDITDLAGNEIAGRSDMHYRTTGTDTLAPSALEAHTLSPAGMYGIGQKIEIAVSFSEAVKVTGSGTPALRLDNGGLAVWDRTSADGHTMVFKYIVGANGESDTYGLDSIDLVDNTDLANHVSDLAGNLLDQAHINYAGLDIPYEDGYGHHDSGGLIQVDAHASAAPGQPALANDSGLAGDGITNAPVFSGSAGSTASFATIRLYDDDVLIGTTSSNADGSWTIDKSPLPDGTHQMADGSHAVVAVQVDGFGNESPVSNVLVFTLDTAAPDKPGTPVLAATSDTGSSDHDGLTADNTPALSGVAAEEGGWIELYVNGSSTPLTSVDVGAGGAWSLIVAEGEPLADGVDNFTVRQVDEAGNRGASSDTLAITVDKTAPAALAKPALATASDSGLYNNDGITKDTTPTLTGSGAEAGASIKLYEGSTLLGTTSADGSGNWSFTIGSQEGYLASFGDGVHTVTAKQADALGNLSAISTGLAITVDTQGPTIVESSIDWKDSKHWFEIEFSERIVFATDRALDVLDTSNVEQSHHAGNAMTNWEIDTNELGVRSVLELNLGSLIGLYHLQGDGAILDLAGNTAIIGTPSFTIPGIPA